ncbi:MAG: 5'-methylthioadenosine/adenosylhomocysteine nucleosidase [Muribaculaceae bacterium]|nr:5'-methylthioadenosine/adenosylhomocysteine nucleosidase [Muribaculaceae bacterium]
MKIGIIVAMGKEMRLLRPMIQLPSLVTINDIPFTTGKIDRHEVIVMQCGIGKVNAAIGTLTLIENFHPELVINTGVAGGAGSEANILDVVVAERIAYHDVWCGPGTEWGEAARCPKFFLTDTELNDLPCLYDDPRIHHGLLCTGDIFVSREDEVTRIRSLYPEVLAVDMESGAIAQVCYLKNVRFFCLRVVSDTPGGADNIAQYENFWDDAPSHTLSLISKVLSSI